ncbi:MAG: serine hydrolase [Patescibacteria group bacterium]|jgi:D-alanyl-D-alanine endopeptidase (penicillin-binding protein 7)
MFNSFLVYLISFLFFSGGIWANINWPQFSYGEIIKIDQSGYFKDKINSLPDPEVSASSIAVLDLNNNFFVLEKNSEQVWPIASISKIMSTLVLLEDVDINLEEDYKVTAEDRRLGGRDYIFVGDELSNYDLLALSLIASDNTAIIALISSAGLEETDFVDLMNARAQKMNLEKTKFYDASGLSSLNVSTAKEVSLLLKEALKREEILELLKKYNYKVVTKNGRVQNIQSTNELLNYTNNGIEVLAGKTGYNDLAGYCLTTKFLLDNNREFISVVLNASTLKNRFADTRRIVEELYNFYNN